MSVFIKNMIMQKHHIKGVQENDRLSDEEKQKAN